MEVGTGGAVSSGIFAGGERCRWQVQDYLRRRWRWWWRRWSKIVNRPKQCESAGTS
jgi:hypothetical protein